MKPLYEWICKGFLYQTQFSMCKQKKNLPNYQPAWNRVIWETRLFHNRVLLTPFLYLGWSQAKAYSWSQEEEGQQGHWGWERLHRWSMVGRQSMSWGSYTEETGLTQYFQKFQWFLRQLPLSTKQNAEITTWGCTSEICDLESYIAYENQQCILA